MIKLQILNQFGDLFEQVKHRLNVYNSNLKNELFEKDQNETNEQAYKRGENIFDQVEDDIININSMITKF